MRAINTYGAQTRIYANADHLFIKIQGTTSLALAENAERTRDIVQKHGGEAWTLSQSDEEADSIWDDRKNGPFACLQYGGPGSQGWPTDVWYAERFPSQPRRDVLTHDKCTNIEASGARERNS